MVPARRPRRNHLDNPPCPAENHPANVSNARKIPPKMAVVFPEMVFSFQRIGVLLFRL